MLLMMLKFVKVFKSKIEGYLRLIAQKYYLDYKIRAMKAKMEILLYHYKAGNKDAQDSYENLICFKNYHISKKN